VAKNKVKFNICNVHYAKQNIDEDGNVSYEVPVAMPGAVSLAMDPNGEPSVFYADGYAYYTISNNQGYEGDLELAMVPESFRTDILKEDLDNKKVLIEKSNVETSRFALLFEFDGDIKNIRHVIYNCSAARPNIESSTKEDDIEVQTETLTIKATPLAEGFVKARTSDTTDEEAYARWYEKVYLPGADVSYEVRFLNYAGDDILATITVPAGADATDLAPTPEVIEGKTFVSWNQDITNITEDMTVRPIYK
jgi:phi13 family phage major tail protein